jgi:hypothetical protein
MQLRGSRRLVLGGSGIWADRVVTGDATASFVNQGTLSVSTDAVSGGSSWSGARFENAAGATFSRSGSGQTRMGGVFDNAGAVSVTSGELWLQGGGTHTGRFTAGAGTVLEFTNAHTLEQGSVVEGTGRVRQARQTGQLVHGGTVRPGGSGASGTLLWTETSVNTSAPFAPTADAVLDVELGGTAAGDFDQVAVTANAVLGGTLRIRRLPAFTPAVGDRFPVVTCSGTCSGAFAALDLPPELTGSVEVSASQAEFVVTAFVADEPAPEAPAALALSAWPNPSVGAVRLGVSLPEAGAVRVTVLDALGRIVAVPLDGERSAGTHAVPLDASRLAPGVYVVRLDSPDGALLRRFTVTR